MFANFQHQWHNEEDPKSKLVDKLHMKVIDSLPNEYIAILDLGFIWHLSTPSLAYSEWSEGTSFIWTDYASKMISVIMMRTKRASQVVLVNDC